MKKRKLLIVTLEPVAGKMAGPAIRSLELARQLCSESLDVTVFSPCESDRDRDVHSAVRLLCGGGRSRLYNASAESDILFIQANVLKPFPALTRQGKYLVVDLYDPYLFSLLEQYGDEPTTASSSYRLMHQVLERHMLAADFAVCASERQRDYWLGRFCALGRINPEVYRFDPSLRKVIDVVPFGTQDKPPQLMKGSIKGCIPGITADDFVLLWGGGIWDWFDPLTVIKAVDLVRIDFPSVKLFFMGLKSPNPQVPLMAMAERSRALARELGLLDSHVFFSEGWVDYEQRANFLLDADVAVSAHFDLIETHFSFRTRMLDYLWAGLPIIATGGDELADRIAFNAAGIAVPYNDSEAWARAIKQMIDDRFRARCRENSRQLAGDFAWSKTVQVLRRFCENPYHLPRHTPVTMPSIFERAHAVYARGGKELVIRRSKELLNDLLK